MTQQHLINVRKKEQTPDITQNLFETYAVEPKTALPTNEINYELELLSKMLKRPYKMVCGLTRDFSLDELREMRTKAETSFKEKGYPADQSWWFLRKKRLQRLKDNL